jgi:hypothetical protein
MRNWHYFQNLGSGCLTPLSIIFQLCLWRSVLLVGKPEYPENITDLLQATDKLYHIKLYDSKKKTVLAPLYLYLDLQYDIVNEKCMNIIKIY